MEILFAFSFHYDLFFPSLSLQSLFTAYLTFTPTLPPLTSDLFTGVTCALLEYVECHAIDPSNTIIGSPISETLKDHVISPRDLTPSHVDVISLLKRWTSFLSSPDQIGKEMLIVLSQLQMNSPFDVGDIAAVHIDAVPFKFG